LLRATKNRFGPCDETGVFTMNGKGLVAVADPSSLLLSDRRAGVAGSIVFPCLEGTRPVLVELQALVAATDLKNARRVAIGLDSRRLTLMVGVMSRGEASFTQKDVFAAAAGGLSVKEPAADLAICLAALSAIRDTALDPDTVAIGEVGLGGEVRKAPGVERRLAEAARLGFRRALVPKGQGGSSGIETREVADLAQAFRSATVSPDPRVLQSSA
jgi:DNA repair protein RadA/Sms